MAININCYMMRKIDNTGTIQPAPPVCQLCAVSAYLGMGGTEKIRDRNSDYDFRLSESRFLSARTPDSDGLSVVSVSLVVSPMVSADRPKLDRDLSSSLPSSFPPLAGSHFWLHLQRKFG